MSACRQFLISGRVQGVFFRASTQRKANALGLTGHAVNLADGRVEVLACGKAQALDQLHEWLQRGPEQAEVQRVEQTLLSPAELPEKFITG